MKYLIVTAICAAAVVMSIVGANVAFDPHGDWLYLTNNAKRPPSNMNNFGERKYKAALVESLPPDSVKLAVFGNSRATSINVSEVERDGGGLNLAFGGARLSQIVTFIETVSRRHPHMRPIVAIDFDQCLGNSLADSLYLRPWPDYPSISDAAQRMVSIRTLYTGFWGWLKPGAFGDSSVGRYGNTETTFDYGDLANIAHGAEIERPIYLNSYRQNEYSRECIATLKSLRRAHPNSIIFINPVSAQMLGWIAASGRTAALEVFLNDLRSVGPVYNFLCADEITTDAQNYRDAQHYRAEIGRLIVADLLQADTGRPLKYACKIE